MSNTSKTASDSDSQITSKSAKAQGVRASKSTADSVPTEPVGVPSGDSNDTKKVTSSDKQNNKRSDKPTPSDPDLTFVVQAWPQLPGAIRSGILALVRASSECDRT